MAVLFGSQVSRTFVRFAKTCAKPSPRTGRSTATPPGRTGSTCWFNKKLLGKATATVPAGGYPAETFLTDVAKLKAAEMVPLCLGSKDPFAHAELFENTLLGVIGADGWASLTADRLDWNGRRSARRWGGFGALLDYADPEAGALTWDQATRKLAAGGCVFESMNDSAYGELVVDGAKEGTDFGLDPVPAVLLRRDRAFAQSKDINVFNQALLDAVNQVPPPPH